jgi:AcrR family transcriptional regulator
MLRHHHGFTAGMGEKGQENRQRILEAANALFYQQGFNKTSFSDIAEAADVPRGNFYYYFKTKDELLEAVIAMRLDGIRTSLAAFEHETADPKERLKRLGTMLVNEAETLIEFGCPMGTLNLELCKIKAAQRDDARSMFELFIDWAAEQFTALGKGTNARALAMHLMSMLQGSAVMSTVYHDPTLVSQEVGLVNEWIDSL